MWKGSLPLGKYRQIASRYNSGNNREVRKGLDEITDLSCCVFLGSEEQ